MARVHPLLSPQRALCTIDVPHLHPFLLPSSLKDTQMHEHTRARARAHIHMRVHANTGKMVQQVKTPALKPDDFSSIPRSHMVEGERSLLQSFPQPPHAHCGVRCTPTHTHN